MEVLVGEREVGQKICWLPCDGMVDSRKYGLDHVVVTDVFLFVVISILENDQFT